MSSRSQSCELKDGGFSAEFSVKEHDASGATETQFYLPDTFPTQELLSRRRFKPGGRTLIWVSSGDVPP
jgi:hypothetical protein